MGAKIEIKKGERFGLWVVLSENFDEIIGGRHDRKFLCRCDCGKERIVKLNHLRSGASKGCGCKNGQCFFKHGYKKDTLYGIWKKIRSRCYYPNNDKYGFYGGRGIVMCDEWEHDPIAFHKWAENNGFRKGLTIDRINNNKGYSPDNCRWVDMIIQSNNRRDNIYYDYNGEKITIPQICRKYGWWDKRNKLYYEVRKMKRDLIDSINKYCNETNETKESPPKDYESQSM